MKNHLYSISLFALSLYLQPSLALAQNESVKIQPESESGKNKQSETHKNTLKARADLHERISKAHKNAADCLKGGKRSESDCTAQLSKECEATGASKECMVKQSESMAGEMGTDQT